ncbi:MAG: HAMP domain-containing histidine kinase [Lachnospiraceae bacterium]|nr:HAMP domain-containing histidine kinase [Lachnospiraceae bacterium]
MSEGFVKRLKIPLASQNIFIQNGVLAISSRFKGFIKLVKSFQVQVFLVITVISTLIMVIYLGTLISTYDERAYAFKVSEIQGYGNVIANKIIANGILSVSSVADASAEMSALAEIYDGRIIVVDDNLKIIKDTYGLEEGKTLISEETILTFRGTNSLYRNNEERYVELTLPIIHPTTKNITGALIMSFSLDSILNMEKNLRDTAGVVGTLVFIVLVVFAALYVRWLVRPFRRLKVSMDNFTDGYIDTVKSVHGFTEFEAVNDSFARMIERANALESSRQEFVSNVSHELKTPMTSIKVLADSLLSQEEVSNELYREFMVDINEEIERENKIINDLLSLVKLDKKSGEMNITNANMNDMIEQILKRLKPIAEQKGVELVFESFRNVVAGVDEVKLSLALTNLVENAIKYNVEDGWVRVSLNADHKYFFVKVSDSGIGIPKEAQDLIFDRFYRVDKARSRGTGGTGLGLSITKNVVIMHKGAIKVFSKENEGTTFTVRIPLNYRSPIEGEVEEAQDEE